MTEAIFRRAGGDWLQLGEPVQVLSTADPAAVPALLEALEARVERERLHAGGYLAYEAAGGFDGALRTAAPDGRPVCAFGLFRRATPRHALPWRGAAPGADWVPECTSGAYRAAFDRLKQGLRDGAHYQVNLSQRLRARLAADPASVFARLVKRQPAAHAAYLRLGGRALLSVSPELFFERDGALLRTRPMKGTAPRGAGAADQEQARCLRASAKERAENLMIVDLLRNDLGRIARPGTVSVPALFEVEAHPTVWQMTSSVEAHSDASLAGVLAALFPCASVTGAPKAAAMAAIAGLEESPRGVYTGAIGYVGPGRQARFGVAIRTLDVQAGSGAAEYGIGSGVVWDSAAEAEYEECLAKARVLLGAEDFALIETLRWRTDTGYWLLDAHCARLERSAAFFGWPAPDAARAHLLERARAFPARPQRVRLMYRADEVFTIDVQDFEPPGAAPVRLGLAPQTVPSADPFLRHKTTRRARYEAGRTARPDCDDVVFCNEAGELTETSIANLAFRRDGRWWTPPERSGLLPGTLRAALLERHTLAERVLPLAELGHCEALAVLNSVRGWQPARWVAAPAAVAQA